MIIERQFVNFTSASTQKNTHKIAQILFFIQLPAESIRGRKSREFVSCSKVVSCCYMFDLVMMMVMMMMMGMGMMLFICY